MSYTREILENATMAQADMKPEIDPKKIIRQVKELIQKAKNDIEEINEIDIKNQNGFKIDFQVIEEIQEEISKIEIPKTKNIGTICVIYDGNTYCLLEMALKAILTQNSMILTTRTSNMKATNNLILTIIHKVLEENDIDKKLIQKLKTTKIEELLSNNVSINKVIAIGNREFQDQIIKISEIETIKNGYNNFDIYIEDTTNLADIKDLIEYKENVDIYVKKGTQVSFKKYVEVKDINQAITLINFNTAGGTSCIFTDNEENAKKFVKQVKTANTYENRNPFFNNILNIDISEFLKTKKVISSEISTENENKEIEEVEEEKDIKKQEENEIEQENIKLQEENQNLLRENTILKENNESIRKGNDLKIQELTKRLEESQELAKKYMNKFKKSALSRIFGKLKKQELEKDNKMLS